MNKISNFKNFDVNEAVVVAGFGQTGIQQFGLGGGRPESGYSMTPVVGVVGTLYVEVEDGLVSTSLAPFIYTGSRKSCFEKISIASSYNFFISASPVPDCLAFSLVT